ncbi:MAG: amidohydrolase family protein, partial [Sphaerochaeta sp.]
MNTRITNALIIPMDREGHSFIGDIALEGSTITYVGSVGPEFVAHRTIDATGYIALPSLFNSHTHLSMGLMRNYKDNEPTLEAWLAQIFPIEAKLQKHDILTASRVGILEALQSGTGFFLDMYFNAEATAQAVIEAGLRANLGLTLFGSIEDSKERVKRWDRNVSPILNDSLSYS